MGTCGANSVSKWTISERRGPALVAVSEKGAMKSRSSSGKGQETGVYVSVYAICIYMYGEREGRGKIQVVV